MYFPTLRVYNPSLLIILLVHWYVKLHSSEYECEVEYTARLHTPASIWVNDFKWKSMCTVLVY